MKGSFFLGADKDEKFEVREMEFGTLARNEVLVETMACGICGTDVHIYHGEKGSADVAPPVVLGHEFAGVIKAVGTEVKEIKVGDHVTVDPNMYCRKCHPCRMGKKQNCEHLLALGVNCNGGFAQYTVSPVEQCFKLNDQLSFDEGAMAEPLACAIHGIEQAGIKPGQNVLIVGGGTIGLLMVQLAKLSGASSVVLSEPIAMRRQIAFEVGADAVIDPIEENISERMQQITGREGADVVIECVGKVSAVKQAINAADPGAAILLFSVPSVDALVELPLFDVFKKELKIMGSKINPNTHQQAVNLLNSGRLEIKKLITHIYGLSQMDEAIHRQMGNDSIKVMVHPQEITI